jgi:hypothetical protein
LNAHPRQGGVDPELAEVGVLLQAPDGSVGLQVRLSHAASGVGPVVEALDALLYPAPQRPVDGRAGRPEVGGDALDVPAPGVQSHHRHPPLARFAYLVVGREAAHHAQRHRFLGEDALDRSVVRPPAFCVRRPARHRLNRKLNFSENTSGR